MITSIDLVPDREFTDSEGDVRRVIDVRDGKVDYVYCEKGQREGFRQSYPVWKFLNYVNGRKIDE
jgi:hypothetical protein